MEVWANIPGYEGLYQVSNLGNVKSLERFMKNASGGLSRLRERILRPAEDPHGYLHVNLSRDGKSKVKGVHRCLAEAFIPNPRNKEQINHIDGNKKNNLIQNLEWVTKSENQIHAYETGLQAVKKVIDTETGVVYNCAKYASEAIGINSSTLRGMLSGRTPNKTNFRYL